MLAATEFKCSLSLSTGVRMAVGGGGEIVDSLHSNPIMAIFYFCFVCSPHRKLKTHISTSPQVSKEGDDFTVDMEVARMSELVKGMLEGEPLSDRVLLQFYVFAPSF